MKLRKLISGIAVAAVAVSTFAISASASLLVVENAPNTLSSGSGMWLAGVYCPSEGVDFGIDYTSISKVQFQITTDDQDFFEGMFGGALVTSCGPTSMTPEDHNWTQQSFWGCIDDELGINTQDAASPILAETLGDYTYQLTLNIDETNCFYNVDSPDGYAKIAIMEWGSDLSQIVVKGAQCYNDAGEVVIAFDGEGNVISTNASADDATEAPADDATEAPADDATEAPAAGDVAGTTDSSKGSPDTGVEDVAVVAGLAIVAAGAVLATKKRK